MEAKKAQQVRIGNIILWDGELYTVRKSFFDQIKDDESDIEFVELTEDWLLRMGFSKDGRGYYYKDFELTEIEIDLKSNKVWIKHEYFQDLIELCKIYFTHELQNLMHALGHELTIKDK